jgi:hypothetical protein
MRERVALIPHPREVSRDCRVAVAASPPPPPSSAADPLKVVASLTFHGCISEA